MTDPWRTRRVRLTGSLWAGLAIGVVTGVVLALAGVALVDDRGDDPLEPGPLVILTGRDASPGGQRQALVDLWNALNPDHQARLEVIAEPADGQRAEMLNHAGTAVDIYNLDVTWTAEFAQQSYLRPIDESRVPQPLLGGFLDKPLSTCRYQGRLWALPFNTDAGLIFYRSDLIRPREKDGQPWFDWATIATASAGVPDLRAAHPDLLAGYAGQLNDYEGRTVNGLEAIWAAGGTVTDSAGRVTFDPKKWQAGLSRLAVPPAGAPARGVVLPDSLRFDEDLSRDAFGAGRVMFMRNWPIAYRGLSGTDATHRPAAVPFSVALLPGPSVLGGQNLAIARGTPRPRAAQALIQFLTSGPSQRMLFERGGFAATQKAVYEDKAVQKDNPYVRVLRQAIEEARMRPVTPYYADFTREFQDGVGYALQHDGQVSPEFGDTLTRALQGR